jgi:hypothetical protein
MLTRNMNLRRQRHDQHDENEQTDCVEHQRVVGRPPTLEFVGHAETSAGQARGHASVGSADRVAAPARPDRTLGPRLPTLSCGESAKSCALSRWLARRLPGCDRIRQDVEPSNSDTWPRVRLGGRPNGRIARWAPQVHRTAIAPGISRRSPSTKSG